MIKFKYGILVLFLSALISCNKNSNHIKVVTVSGLNVENVEIKKGFTSINRNDDRELFSNNMVTIFNGEDVNKLETNFGENDFLILYDNKYYYSFRHFIQTDFVNDFPEGHDYNFKLYVKNDTIYCDIDIQGEQPMKFTKQLIRKENAKDYIGNTPKEKAGVIFNMKEFEEKKELKNVSQIIKSTQKKIKTDCFFILNQYRIYLSQFSLNNYCDRMLKTKKSRLDSLFYSDLKKNCISTSKENDNSSILEILLNQDIKIRNLDSDKWATEIIINKIDEKSWSINGIFESDTLRLMEKTRKHNTIYSK